MKWLSFALLSLGLLISVIGWAFDRSTQIPWLHQWVDEDHYEGIDALEALSQNEKRALLPVHPGFWVLLQHWPSPVDITHVNQLRRSVAFTEFGPQIVNDFEIIAYDATQNEQQGERWRYSAAKTLLTEAYERKVFWLGAVVFFIGIAIAFVAGLVQMVLG